MALHLLRIREIKCGNIPKLSLFKYGSHVLHAIIQDSVMSAMDKVGLIVTAVPTDVDHVRHVMAQADAHFVEDRAVKML